MPKIDVHLKESLERTGREFNELHDRRWKMMERLKSTVLGRRAFLVACLTAFGLLSYAYDKDKGSEHPRGFISYAYAQHPNQEHIPTPAQSQKGMIDEFRRAQSGEHPTEHPTT